MELKRSSLGDLSRDLIHFSPCMFSRVPGMHISHNEIDLQDTGARLLYVMVSVWLWALFETKASAPDSAQAIAWSRGCMTTVRASHTRSGLQTRKGD